MNVDGLYKRLTEFIEQEVRSCSMEILLVHGNTGSRRGHAGSVETQMQLN